MAQEFGISPSQQANLSAVDGAIDRVVFAVGNSVEASIHEASQQGGPGARAVLDLMVREAEEELRG
jgi:hypothetical protein